jgi:alpha-ribazole phosphatase/probable phosphoglycerate mutase
MITIVNEAHSTTLDNEKHVVSGWNDVELSPLGVQQSIELGMRRSSESFDAIFCSDLQRACKTAEIAFGEKFPIIRDKRLRECNYGNFTHKPSDFVDKEKINRIRVPFPDGESYLQTNERMKSFLEDLLKNNDGKKVMIIGHRATQYGLEYWINKVPLEKQVSTPWKWQPGWTYYLEKI